MSTPAAPSSAVPAPPKRSFGDILFDFVLWGGIAVLLVISFAPTEMFNLPRLVTNSDRMQAFLRDFLQPDFTNWKLYVGQMWLTIQIALWGTALAVFIAVPLGLAAARNIAPAWLVFPVRRVLDILRSIPDLVMGTLFLIAMGLGPLAGVLAIALNTGGVLGKLFSEAVEAIDKGPVEGVRATGGARLHEIMWGVIPQVAPLWTSFALYRFESNSRAATVLGLIGAGGIGKLLFDSLNSFNSSQVAAIAIVIVVAVFAIDTLSQLIRKRLL